MGELKLRRCEDLSKVWRYGLVDVAGEALVRGRSSAQCGNERRRGRGGHAAL